MAFSITCIYTDVIMYQSMPHMGLLKEEKYSFKYLFTYHHEGFKGWTKIFISLSILDSILWKIFEVYLLFHGNCSTSGLVSLVVWVDKIAPFLLFIRVRPRYHILLFSVFLYPSRSNISFFLEMNINVIKLSFLDISFRGKIFRAIVI